MYNIILVPIDLSEQILSEKVAPHIEQLARVDDPHIHFLHIIPEYKDSAYFRLAADCQRVNKEELLKLAENELKKMTQHYNLPEDRVYLHVLMGKPKDIILKMAKSLKADLIVISSHQPSISRYFIGSNAAAVIQNANISVLVIR